MTRACHLLPFATCHAAAKDSPDVFRTVGRQDRAGCATDAHGGHLQQPGQRQHHRLQEFARLVPGPGLPERAPAGRPDHRADRIAFGPDAGHRRAGGRHRETVYPGQPQPDRQRAGRRNPGPRFPAGVDARRFDLLHPRRLAAHGPERTTGDRQRLLAEPVHHHPAERAGDHHRHRRHRQRHGARPVRTDPGRNHPDGGLRQSRGPATDRRQPLRRNRLERFAATRPARPERHGPARPGFARNLERQRGRGAGQYDRNPARVRDELKGHLRDRFDAARPHQQDVTPMNTRPFRALASLLAAAALAGCATSPPHVDPAFAPTLPIAQEAPPPADGAIYHDAGSLELFSDPRAHRVGDILTIVLAENTQASKKAETTTSKKDSVDVGAATLWGKTFPLNGGKIASLSGNNGFDGSGSSSQSNQLSGQITVTVAQRLSNGNLVLRGEKWLTINQGRELVRISGIARPEDISPDNTILSTRIANAQIAYTGSGTLADANTQGWLSRFFNSKWMPF